MAKGRVENDRKWCSNFSMPFSDFLPENGRNNNSVITTAVKI
jgi:hypothetical protein